VSSRFIGSVRKLEMMGSVPPAVAPAFWGCCRGSALPCGPGCGGGTAQNRGGIEPGDEVRDGPVIGHAGVLVADGGGEEFEEAADSGVAAPAIAAGTARPRRPGGSPSPPRE
jgi:hypothetical protein